MAEPLEQLRMCILIEIRKCLNGGSSRAEAVKFLHNKHGFAKDEIGKMWDHLEQANPNFFLSYYKYNFEKLKHHVSTLYTMPSNEHVEFEDDLTLANPLLKPFHFNGFQPTYEIPRNFMLPTIGDTSAVPAGDGGGLAFPFVVTVENASSPFPSPRDETPAENLDPNLGLK